MSQQPPASAVHSHILPSLHQPHKRHHPRPSLGVTQVAVQPALNTPHTLAPSDILQLQGTIGNQAVQRLLQRDTQAGFEAGSDFENQLKRTQGGGSPLPQKTKNEFEQSLGKNLDNVRIHTNAQSNQLNRSIQAKAFTHGNDIHFDAGEFNPTTTQGKHLLAHELTHTIQQTGGQSRGDKSANLVQTKLQVGAANDRHEQEADRIAQSVSSGRSARVSNVQPTTSPSVQRMLKFKPEDLQGDLSKKAKRAGKLGIISTYRRLQTMLNTYWTSHGDLNKQLNLLLGMDQLSAKWLKEHRSSYDKGNSNDKLKYASVARLSTEINTEITKTREKMESRDFMEKFEKNSPYLTGIGVGMAALPIDPVEVGKQVSHNRRHNMPHTRWNSATMEISNGHGGMKKVLIPGDYTDEEKSRQLGEAHEQQQYDEYRAKKKYGLTTGHRAVLNSYTGDQFQHINPAMANDAEWMKGAVGKNKDDAYIKKAMGLNQELGAMVTSALNKLPPWKHTQPLYRGETMTDQEANSIKVGFNKHFGHFVSTSLKLGVAQSVMQNNRDKASTARPWTIIYHITDSTSGRDVSEFSLKNEQEILFPANTSFQVTKILENDPAKKHLEVEVKQI